MYRYLLSQQELIYSFVLQLYIHALNSYEYVLLQKVFIMQQLLKIHVLLIYMCIPCFNFRLFFSLNYKKKIFDFIP